MFSANEQWYLTLGYGDGRFLARDMATGMLNIQTNRSLEIKELIQAAASPDGNLIAAASLRGFVRLFDRASLLEVGTLRGFLVEAVFSVCFSPDGKRLATGSGGREAIRLWDIERQQQLLRLEGDRFGNWGKTKISPDGNLIGSVNGNSLHVWRAPSWAEIEAEEAASTKTQ
jgi:WD40 repeat protein